MSVNTTSGTISGSPLISSDRVEGTKVFDLSGNAIGSVKRLMLEKVSGRVANAVLSFGGFMGLGDQEYPIPWSKLTYDTKLGGYRTDLTESQLKGAPTSTRNDDWSDRDREIALHDYYQTTYYWDQDRSQDRISS